MASANAIEDNSVAILKTIGSTAEMALRFGEDALPIIQFVAGFVPGAAPAVQVLSVALPIVEKIAAGAPVVASAIDENRDVLTPLIDRAPNIYGHLKELYSAVSGHLGKDVPASEVSHEMLAQFGGVFSRGFEAGFFTPQDPRFDRDDPSSH